MLKRAFTPRKYTSSRNQFGITTRKLIWRREVIITTVALTVFFSLMTPGQYLLGLGFWSRLTVNSIAAAYFLIVISYLLPPVVWWCLKHNIPWFWSQLISYIPLSLTTSVMMIWVFESQASLKGFWWLFLVITVNTILATAFATLLLKDFILREFAVGSEKFPLWWPTPFDDCQLQNLLPRDKRGKVIRLSAENQYVQVYTVAGATLLRLSLTEAVKLVPANNGIRVHRSHWISKNNIQDFWFDKGNPRISDLLGEVIPVSRSKVSIVRALSSE